MHVRWRGGIGRHRAQPRAPQCVNGRVVGNSEQPARQTPCGVECREFRVRLDEGLLCKIFGDGVIPLLAQDAEDESDDRALVAPDDSLESGLRPSQGLGNEPGLGDRLEIDRDGPRSSC